MPSNVEIKARLEDFDAFHTLFKKVYNSKDDSCKTLEQCDTFFKCTNGRLKLREVKEQDKEFAELIFYDRSDVAGPRKSDYVKYESQKESGTLKEALTLAHGKRGEVKKTRLLYVVEQTRVHIDKVNGVGAFVELEVQLKDGQTTEDGQKVANEFMEKLNITSDMLVEGSYIDLLEKDAGSDAKKNGDVSDESKKPADVAEQDKEMKEVSEEVPAKTDAAEKETAAAGDAAEKKAEDKPKDEAEGDAKVDEAKETKEEKQKEKDEEDSAKAKPEKDAKTDEAGEQMDTEDAAPEKTVEAKAAETPASEVAVDANTEA